jgi:hypothetical protein
MCVSRSLGGRAEGLVILSCNSWRSNLAKCRNLSKGKKGRKMPLYYNTVSQSLSQSAACKATEIAISPSVCLNILHNCYFALFTETRRFFSNSGVTVIISLI